MNSAKFEDAMRRALEEDTIRCRILLRSKNEHARLLGQRLSEHGPECPYWSAASAVAVHANKPLALARIKGFCSVESYCALTLIPAYGVVPGDCFSKDQLPPIARKLRDDLKRANMCQRRPGFFAIDFEFDSTMRNFIVHFHAIVHARDAKRRNALRELPAFKSRVSCRAPVHLQRARSDQTIEGYVDYMIKSTWTARPSCPSRKSIHRRRWGPQRIQSPHFERLLLEIETIHPKNLMLRVGGGKGQH